MQGLPTMTGTSLRSFHTQTQQAQKLNPFELQMAAGKLRAAVKLGAGRERLAQMLIEWVYDDLGDFCRLAATSSHADELRGIRALLAPACAATEMDTPPVPDQAALPARSSQTNEALSRLERLSWKVPRSLY